MTPNRVELSFLFPFLSFPFLSFPFFSFLFFSFLFFSYLSTSTCQRWRVYGPEGGQSMVSTPPSPSGMQEE